MDIAGTIGAPVVAAATGEVQFAGTAGSSGVTVSIRTAEGLDTSYLNMSSVAVRKGERVSAGSRIGAVGTTGRRSVERPHLHFGVRASGTATTTAIRSRSRRHRFPRRVIPCPRLSRWTRRSGSRPKPPRCRCGDRWRHPSHAACRSGGGSRRVVAAGRAQSPGHGGAPAAVPAPAVSRAGVRLSVPEPRSAPGVRSAAEARPGAARDSALEPRREADATGCAARPEPVAAGPRRAAAGHALRADAASEPRGSSFVSREVLRT